MKVDQVAVARAVREFDFKALFFEELGWDRLKSPPLTLEAGEERFVLQRYAQKRDVIVLTCPSIPPADVRKALDQKVHALHAEHLLLFHDNQAGRQVWLWASREPNEPMVYREQEWVAGNSGLGLAQRLARMAFGLEEEKHIRLGDVTSRLRAAFDSSPVVRKFYRDFSVQRKALALMIQGVSLEPLSVYTSITLNRLMFVYFIQRRGFLAGDTEYLRHKLEEVQRKGAGQFHSFFRQFLLKLFHGALARPLPERDADVCALVGDVPYLNGGLFDIHEIERAHGEIDIKDEAFERLFDFFDAYDWTLQTGQGVDDKRIDPDVVGYIFEKYVNEREAQKTAGAFYTQEDITSYMCVRSILLALVDCVREDLPDFLDLGDEAWSVLVEDPWGHVSPSLRHGLVRDGVVVPLEEDQLDCEQRLPRETRRELVARRLRCVALEKCLRSGEVKTAEALVTENLEFEGFFLEVVGRASGDRLLVLWNALERLTVLDPTCGSGAFLLAALHLLAEVKGALLCRARDIRHQAGFPAELEKVVADYDTSRPSPTYAILRSILTRNLYGVDLMADAVEICKLRLFLRLISEVEHAKDVEPLPDLDFNVCHGNSLVGYVDLRDFREKRERSAHLPFDQLEADAIESQARVLEDRFSAYQRVQAERAPSETLVEAKREAQRARLVLNELLDRHMAGAYDIDPDDERAFTAWKSTHRPFHWLSTFYRVARAGGFRAVVGNPPYVRKGKKVGYTLLDFTTARCNNTYTWVLERSARVLHERGVCSMIVPLSLTFSKNHRPCRDLMSTTYSQSWFSTFARIPAGLFTHDTRTRNTIHIGRRQGVSGAYTTRLHRWNEEFRPHLFEVLEYFPFAMKKWSGRIPKLNSERLIRAFERLLGSGRKLKGALAQIDASTAEPLVFRDNAYNYVMASREEPPCYELLGTPTAQTKVKTLMFPSAESRDLAMVVLNGKLLFAYWIAIGDDFDVTMWNLTTFPFNPSALDKETRKRLLSHAERLAQAMSANLQFKKNKGLWVGSYNTGRCRALTDLTDAILVKALSLDEVWEDVELLHDQIVRTDYNETKANVPASKLQTMIDKEKAKQKLKEKAIAQASSARGAGPRARRRRGADRAEGV